MSHTIATAKHSTKEQRRNRKGSLWSRIRREISRATESEGKAKMLLDRIKADMDELIEIGGVEGYQQGKNDTEYRLKSQESKS